MASDPKTNKFIRALAPSDYEGLAPHLREIELPFAETLFEPGHRISSVIFPTSGIVSYVVPLFDGEAVEAGMVGREGVVGASAVLDGAGAFSKAVVQMKGAGLAADVDVVRNAVQKSKPLRESLYRYDQLIFLQAQQSAACNVRHPLEARLARWLLRCRDVAETDTLALTQEYMAQMLGVQRSTLSLVAHHLQASNVIEYSRGRVRILNLEGLKECSCECYEVFREQQAALFGKNSLHDAFS